METLLSYISSKRIQGIVLLILIHFIPEMNGSAYGIDLQHIALGWLVYGVVSADKPALPKVTDVYKSTLNKIIKP